MKKLYIGLFISVVLGADIHAQQIFRRTQFPLNTFMVNPAAAGTQSYIPVFLSYRNQWTGFSGAPKTMVASAHTPLPFNLGTGVIIYNDNTGGAISRTGVEASASYKTEISDRDAVSFGLSLTASQFKFANSKLKAYDPNDVTLNGGLDESKMLYDATFGFLVYGKQYYAGFSIPQLFRAKMKFNQSLDPNENSNWRHFQFMGSYRYYINEVFDIQPSAFIRLTKATPAQIDVNVKVNYLDYAWAGFTYRHKDALALMLGGTWNEFTLGYSFDLTISKARNLSPFTHEIIVGYYIQRNNGKFKLSKLGPKRLSRGSLVH